MDLLEYQGKRLYAAAGLPVPPGRVAGTPEEACAAALEMGPPVAVKAQVRSGGRGKAGGVRVCASADEAAEAAADVLALTIRGRRATAVLVEKAADIAREMYVTISLSRDDGGPVLVFSPEGGSDVEDIARRHPGALVRAVIDPLLGVCDYQVRDVVAQADLWAPEGAGAGAAQQTRRALEAIVRGLWRLYRDTDATLVEINPLVVTRQGQLLCLDSKVAIDDNALYRHPEFAADAEAGMDEREIRARRAGLSYVSMSGDIGLVGNGAGLVMSTIDQIAVAGGSAANFCDIGGGARAEDVAAALDVILSGDDVRTLLVSIFGGITRCDEVARGLSRVFGRSRVTVPVIVRLDGNAAERGRAILAEARLDGVRVAGSAAEAVRLAVAAARGRAGALPASPGPGASSGTES